MWTLRFPFPDFSLGVRCSADAVLEAAFLPVHPGEEGASALARTVWQQLLQYRAQGQFSFTLPLQPQGSEHDRKVWQWLCQLPAGQPARYGEGAAVLGSSVQAVGNACGRNPIPLLIPCHRVVGQDGLGGFMQGKQDGPLSIKHWLLQHESRQASLFD